MPSNTTNLEGYTVFSSVSLAGSGSTLLAQDVTSRGSFVANWASITSAAFAGGASMTTLAAATAAPDGGFGIVFRASGLSIVYRSGSTIYSIAGSATSGAA